MRKVMVSEHKKQSSGAWELEERGEALFHQFGVDYEEFESGSGNFTTAVIEWDGGKVENVPVHLVRFLDSPFTMA
jgi:hypothetical protein